MEPFSRWQDSPSEPWRVLAERKIAEWILQGQSKDLPGQGQPLALEVNPFEPPGMRLANKILKNAGFVPPWIEAGRQVETQRARRDLELDRLRQELARIKRIGRPAGVNPRRASERISP